MTDDRTLATDYLLGELDDASRAEVQSRLQSDSAFRAQVESLRPLVGRLQELPVQAWSAPDEVQTERPSFYSRARRQFVVVGAVAAVAVVAATGGYLLNDSTTPTQTGPSIVLRPIGAGAPRAAQATATMTASRHMNVDVSGLPPTRPGHFYELWLIGADKQVVSLASFDVTSTGHGSLNIPLPVDPRRFNYLDVSVQTVSAGPAHSGDSVLRAPVI